MLFDFEITERFREPVLVGLFKYADQLSKKTGIFPTRQPDRYSTRIRKIYEVLLRAEMRNMYNYRSLFILMPRSTNASTHSEHISTIPLMFLCTEFLWKPTRPFRMNTKRIKKKL
ncbi:hypothetical protein CEXT_767571 [Caerostris extrusa]|uniref:Uncharacterized protein n=1 Tax=Caerostris extrusa TaxID=172846 RepID=A0AAV4XEY7_CAEEX|nr:hypothetical protein CEXT_767571 [Caerostris extrusa]